MNLFVKEDFISHAGNPLTWKIECDALSDDDWACIAHMIVERETRPFSNSDFRCLTIWIVHDRKTRPNDKK